MQETPQTTAEDATPIHETKGIDSPDRRDRPCSRQATSPVNATNVAGPKAGPVVAPTAFPKRVAALVLPGFSFMDVSSLIEPLKLVNAQLGQEAYDYFIVTPSATPVPTSLGLYVEGRYSVTDLPKADRVFICSACNAHSFESEACWTWLRYLERLGADLGAVRDGSLFLARAGLLDGYACTIHWQKQATFTDLFPKVDFRPERIVIDRKRLTCMGGNTALEITLDLIERDHSPQMAIEVSRQLIYNRSHKFAEDEVQNLCLRTGLSDGCVLNAVSVMEQHIETPISIEKIAESLNISRDVLERKFRSVTKVSPKQYYMRMRLERALDYLRHSTLSITEIAASCGFSDSAHFAKVFKKTFGHSPSRDRSAFRYR